MVERILPPAFKEKIEIMVVLLSEPRSGVLKCLKGAGSRLQAVLCRSTAVGISE